MLRLIILILLFHKTAFSDVLTFDISNKFVSISENKLEPDFTIYGFTNFKDSIVVKIKGPSQKVILQK